MFTSLFHEMKELINTFANSLQLIQFSFDKPSKSFAVDPSINNSYLVLEHKLFRYFRIGEISS